MPVDLYHVLGLHHDANLSQIRRAHRREMRRLDPDHVPSGDAEPFEAAERAFETLADPVERPEYDRHLAAESASAPALPPAPVIDLMESFSTHRPSAQALWRLLHQNFTGRGIPKSRPVHAIDIDLVLSPDVAMRGSVIPVDVPVAEMCEICIGTGRAGWSRCDTCEGHGLFWQTARVEVVVPRGTGEGTILPISLRHVGIRNAYLNLHVRIAGTGAAQAGS